MNKIIFFLIWLIFLNSCSVDTKSGIWKDVNNDNTISKKIPVIIFDENLDFEKFKQHAIQYGKLSEFPKLDDNKWKKISILP